MVLRGVDSRPWPPPALATLPRASGLLRTSLLACWPGAGWQQRHPLACGMPGSLWPVGQADHWGSSITEALGKGLSLLKVALSCRTQIKMLIPGVSRERGTGCLVGHTASAHQRSGLVVFGCGGHPGACRKVSGHSPPPPTGRQECPPIPSRDSHKCSLTSPSIPWGHGGPGCGIVRVLAGKCERAVR